MTGKFVFIKNRLICLTLTGGAEEHFGQSSPKKIRPLDKKKIRPVHVVTEFHHEMNFLYEKYHIT
jgi:hypothetical protein